MPFRAENRGSLGTGNYTTVLLSHVDDEGNSMRVGHILIPENLVDEFLGNFDD